MVECRGHNGARYARRAREPAMSRLLKLWQLLDRHQRRGLLGIQLLSLLMALSTVGGVAAVMPFFTVLTDPGAVDRSGLLRWLRHLLPAQSEQQFVLALGVGFALLVLISNAVTLFGSEAINRYAHHIGDAFQTALFGEYLHRDHLFHL